MTTSSYMHFFSLSKGVDYPNLYAPFEFSIKSNIHIEKLDFRQ